jgi:hypothetical protein
MEDSDAILKACTPLIVRREFSNSKNNINIKKNLLRRSPLSFTFLRAALTIFELSTAANTPQRHITDKSMAKYVERMMQ